MLVAQALEHVGVGRVTTLRLAPTGEIQVFKEKSRQLLRRVDIDRPMRHVGDLLVQTLQLLVQFARHLLQVGEVDRHARNFDLGEHWHQRHFEIAKQFGVAKPVELGLESRCELQHYAHPVSVKSRSPHDVDLVAGHRRLAAAEQGLAPLDDAMQDVRGERLEAG